MTSKKEDETVAAMPEKTDDEVMAEMIEEADDDVMTEMPEEADAGEAAPPETVQPTLEDPAQEIPTGPAVAAPKKPFDPAKYDEELRKRGYNKGMARTRHLNKIMKVTIKSKYPPLYVEEKAEKKKLFWIPFPEGSNPYTK